MSKFIDDVVRLCNEELAFFHQGAKKEYQDPFYLRVGEYWTKLSKNKGFEQWAGTNGRTKVAFHDNGKVKSNNNPPWSAAFISWVAAEAGAGDKFSYSSSHSSYIVKALKESKNPNSNAKFIARRHNLYTPKIGDLIACERQENEDPNFDTYPSYVVNKKHEAHCDFITGFDEHANSWVTVGGNVSNSVTQKRWPAGNLQRIANSDPNNTKYGVICIIETLL